MEVKELNKREKALGFRPEPFGKEAVIMLDYRFTLVISSSNSSPVVIIFVAAE